MSQILSYLLIFANNTKPFEIRLKLENEQIKKSTLRKDLWKIKVTILKFGRKSNL